MVSKDGFVKILDFGLAKLVEPGSRRTLSVMPTAVAPPTEPGTVMGTVGYMSPEQASGQPLDFRSDQFSLGSILYEMATGKRAFQRKTGAETLVAIIREEPEPLGQLDAEGARPRALDRRALPRQGPGGALRLDQGPRARSRRACATTSRRPPLRAASPRPSRRGSRAARLAPAGGRRARRRSGARR